MSKSFGTECRYLIVNNIKLSPDASYKEAFSVAKSRLARIVSLPSDLSFRIHKKSVDARYKNDIKLVYSVIAEGSFSVAMEDKLALSGVSVYTKEEPDIIIGDEPLSASPVIVGAGPAGLFAGLMLAERGYAPIILERGGDVEARRKSVARFIEQRTLDTDTNIQFGLGGAGTFSDGKLITRISDGLCGYVLRRLVEFGAPEEILYNAKPHIGTDILSVVVTKIAKKIEELGGKIMYNTKFISADFSNKYVRCIKTTSGNIPAGAVILAVGHSARDTHEMLIRSGLSIEPKNFSVGMRIEHLASDIDESMYGDMAGHPALGHAEYSLSHNTKERGVYTFCMCPGGEVVAAASEEGGVTVNGMSYSKRNGVNSNSAVVVSVFKEDYGSSPLAAINFQREIEKKAFIFGGGDYSAPMITVGDFLSGKLSSEPSRVVPTYMNGGVRLSLPSSYLPRFVCSALSGALPAFERKIKGFSASFAVLTGAETRTSAPLRILRNNETKLAFGYENLYPAGEGAGYAGGITSASVDGIRCAMALMNKFKPRS